jgi:hypothetical protein
MAEIAPRSPWACLRVHVRERFGFGTVVVLQAVEADSMTACEDRRMSNVMETKFYGDARPAEGGRPWKMAAICRACGRAPARQFVFRQVTGKVIFTHRKTVEALMCKDCAQRVGRTAQAATLVTGWWGLFSFFSNARAVAANTVGLARAARMPDPVGMAPATAVKVPPVIARPQPWLLAFLIACVIAAALLTTAASAAAPAPASPRSPAVARAVAADPPAWVVGACVTRIRTGAFLPTDCSAAHVGRVVSQAISPTSCPATADSYVTFEGKFLCIDHDQ